MGIKELRKSLLGLIFSVIGIFIVFAIVLYQIKDTYVFNIGVVLYMMLVISGVASIIEYYENNKVINNNFTLFKKK